MLRVARSWMRPYSSTPGGGTPSPALINFGNAWLLPLAKSMSSPVKDRWTIAEMPSPTSTIN
jgi:hypothetical protein